MIGFIVRMKISASPDVTYNQPEILLWAYATYRSASLALLINSW